MNECKTMNPIRYVHGSEDSVDIDVIYVFEQLPDVATCKSFCDGKGNENGNIIVVNDGVVVAAFKGSVDEVNNALFYTYQLHEQDYPLIIEHPVERDVILKDIKVIRKILSSFSRTQFRGEIKEALRGNWETKLLVLKKLEYEKIDFSIIPKTTTKDLMKTLAFQMGQALALHQGIELYTKRAIAEYYPELKDYLYRVDASNENMINFIRRFTNEVAMIPAKVIDNDFVEFCEKEKTVYNINKEIRI